MSSDTSNARRPVAFYDGGCSLCRREIAHYRVIDRDNRVEWIDINTDRRRLEALGVSHEQAMQRMHVLDADGELRDGAQAFIALWSTLPYYRILARLICYTRTTSLLEAAYRRFAAWRYARRREQYECATPQCIRSTGGLQSFAKEESVLSSSGRAVSSPTWAATRRRR